MAPIGDVEPINHHEALMSTIRKKAMKEELVVIEMNDTWEMIELPIDNKYIEVNWVFKLKNNSNRSIAKYKVGLVVIGFMHKQGLGSSACDRH